MLEAGEVGFVIAGIKDIFGAPVGDTITLSTTPEVASLPGFKKVKPQVYAGLFPIDASDFEPFREALQNYRSMTRLYSLNLKVQMRLVLVSVVVSWACCTWKSYKSV